MTNAIGLPATLAVALAVAAFAAAGAGASPVSFTDPVGDSSSAPDITSVSVSDNGTGSITVAVTTVSTLTPGQNVDVFIDTDKNGSTGSPSGSEFNLEAWQDTNSSGWDMARWAGSDWKETVDSPSEHFSRSGNVFTWTVAAHATGQMPGFTFWPGGFMNDASGNLIARDDAPDGGTWVYDLSRPAATIVPAIGKPLAVPARARAGKLLSLSFPLTQADTGA